MLATIEERTFSENAVIPGVRVFTAGRTRNDHQYSLDVLQASLDKFEGSPVFIEHGEKPRSYRDRLGTLRNTRTDAKGLTGDLFYNPEHQHASQVEWDARNSVPGVGLSCSADVDYDRIDGLEVVRKIREVHSCDVVLDPAATTCFVESTQPFTPIRLTEEELRQRLGLTESYRRSGERDRLSADDLLRQLDGRPSRAETADVLDKFTDPPPKQSEPATTTEEPKPDFLEAITG